MINKKLISVITIVLFSVTGLFAQVPEIASIDAQNNFPTATVTIVGSGFNSDPTKMGVSFGGVMANVISSSASLIEVEVPISTLLDNIEVINFDNNLSVKSSSKFYTTFGGSDFDISDINDPIEFNKLIEQFDLCACDLDGDGKRDVVTTKSQTETDINIYHNNSTIDNISFIALDKDDIPQLNVFTPTRNVTCGDLNGDGLPELILGRNDNTRNFVYVLQNTSTPGNISFASKIDLITPSGDKLIRSVVRDLNFDGKPEIITSNSENNLVAIFVNQSSGGGALSFASSPILVQVDGANNTAGIEVQDMDGDNKPDLIVNQFQEISVFVLKNTSGVGAISFASATEITTARTIRNLKVGYINADDKPDIVVTHTVDNSISIIQNSSSSNSFDFNLAGNWGTDTEPWGVDMGDLDGDGDLDIIISNNGLNTLNIFNNESTDATIQFAANIIKPVPDRTRNIVVADFDNDAKPDIAYTSAANLSSGFFSMGVLRNKNCYSPNIRNESTLYICDQPIRLETIPGIGVSYDWYQDNVFVQGPSHGVNTANENFFVVTVSGTYKVYAESDGGTCTLWSQDITVLDESGNVPDTPTAINNGPSCPDSNVQLDVTFPGAADPSWTYEWSGPNGYSSTLKNPVLTGVTIADEGSYSVIVSSGNCASIESTTLVDVLSLQEFTVTASGDTEFCSGGTTVLSVTNRTGHSYQWLKDGTPISGETGVSYVASQAGIYSVTVTNNSTTCSARTNDIAISIFTPPSAQFDVKIKGCLNEEIAFTNNSTFDGTATVSYLWDFGDGTTSTEQSPVHIYNTINIFNISLTVSYDGLNCADVISKGIEIVGAGAFEITANTLALCPGEEVVLEVDDTQFTDILWSTTEISPSIIVTAAGEYTANALNASGCAVEALVTVTEKPVPDIQIATTDDKLAILEGEQIQLMASGADIYAWTPPETLNDTSIANPIAVPLETTTYTVIGTINGGCTSEGSVTIEVLKRSDAPKIFNANNSVGELWTITNEEATSCVLTIFDRNGSKVFEGSGNEVQWDGTSGGSKLPGGTYFFVFGCDQDKPRTGSILLVDL